MKNDIKFIEDKKGKKQLPKGSVSGLRHQSERASLMKPAKGFGFLLHGFCAIWVVANYMDDLRGQDLASHAVQANILAGLVVIAPVAAVLSYIFLKALIEWAKGE